MEPKTIAIRDPVIRGMVASEQKRDQVATATEMAYHLIRDGIEWRRIQRALAGNLVPSTTADAASHAPAA